MRNAFIVTADGKITAIDASLHVAQAGALWDALDEGRLTGVSVLDGKPRQLVAAPIMAPQLIGWVVFAADLDQREMRGLESLSAIPLHAAVLAYDGKRWFEAAGSMSGIDNAAAESVVQHVGSGTSFGMDVGGRSSIALAKTLPAFAGDERAVLLLAYPKAEALADARKLQLALAAMTLLGLLLVAYATWKAASRITSHWPASTKQRGAWPRASQCRSRCAVRMSWRASPTASTKWSARSPSASSASRSLRSTMS